MSVSLVPLARAWNSWDADHPAEMTYLPLGLRVGLCAYASSANAFTRFPAGGEGVRLGPRSLDGDAEIGRASCRERVCRTCKSRWSPYHYKTKHYHKMHTKHKHN